MSGDRRPDLARLRVVAEQHGYMVRVGGHVWTSAEHGDFDVRWLRLVTFGNKEVAFQSTLARTLDADATDEKHARYYLKELAA
jgi:hypothetical protein